MEEFLLKCSGLLSADFPLFISIILAGLVGSISHCSVMCSPLVASQMLDLKQRNKPQIHMVYYHAGRITTYMLLGVMAVIMSKFVFSGSLEPYTNMLLMFAGVTFIASAILPRKTHACCSEKTQKLQKLAEKLPVLSFVYYARGILMGFVPCGMIIAVLLAVATLISPLEAALIMFLFGLTTVPILQIIGYGALSVGKHYPEFSNQAGRVVMALNGIFLFELGLNFVSIT